ncbi:hypothetical protein HMF8227_02564 [Saliniradius amylolyticus]|uniref:Uncharacterized protein n=1 Tax=Saliniradius amylolyticus TaxID=2183582 RepID=A0A2S2E5T2_9ALTE|nr:hypothetical protein [Saliniradius amylolyticus]AWL13016.1 hypothetical protein HMF8227_02564 [Saliniradius amylolyticus]
MSSQCQLTDQLELLVIQVEPVRVSWDESNGSHIEEGVLVGLDASQGQEWLTLKSTEQHYRIALSEVIQLTRLRDNGQVIPFKDD